MHFIYQLLSVCVRVCVCVCVCVLVVSLLVFFGRIGWRKHWSYSRVSGTTGNWPSSSVICLYCILYGMVCVQVNTETLVFV